jgi:hypothetical protein
MNWATSKGLKLEPMKRHMPLLNFNREEDESATITHFLVRDLKLHNHLDKKAFLFATRLSRYLIILGLPWLKLHNPELSFRKETMLFNSAFCQKHCNTPLKPTRARAIPNIPERDRPKNVTCTVTTPEPAPKALDVQPVSLRAMSMYAQQGLTVHQVSLC